MKIETPLKEGRLIKRYKRFFADVDTGRETLTIHVPNSGSMRGCSEPGSACLFSMSDDPKRKLKGTLLYVQANSGAWVGVNTGFANPLVYELWENKQYFPWQGWDRCEREVKIHDSSRLDLVMWDSRDGFKGARPKPEDFDRHRFHFVEVKNVSLAENNCALFPDAVTERGQKHLRDLVDLVERGHTAELVFVIQRGDATRFAPADEIDAVYGRELRRAMAAGVLITPLLAEFGWPAAGNNCVDVASTLAIRPMPIQF